MKIDKKSGVDLDELRKQFKVYADVGPEGRRATSKEVSKLFRAYPESKSCPPEIRAVLNEFRRLTHFTSYIEDVIIIRAPRVDDAVKATQGA